MPRAGVLTIKKNRVSVRERWGRETEESNALLPCTLIMTLHNMTFNLKQLYISCHMQSNIQLDTDYCSSLSAVLEYSQLF